MRYRVVLAEAMTGLMVAGGLLKVTLAVLMSAAAEGAPVWADRTRVTTLVCIFTLPLMIGVAAIVSARRTTGLGAVAAASPVGPSHPALVVAVAASAWATLICAVQAVVPLLVRLPMDPVPWTALLSWLQAWASLVAGAWLGASWGMLWRTRMAGPLLALMVFAGLYISNYLPGRLRLAAPFDSPWYVPWIQPAAGAPIGHSLIAAGIGLAAAAALWSGRGIRLAAAAASLVFVIVGSTVVASVADPLRYEPRPMPDGPVCRDIGGDVRFCAHPLAGETGDEAARALTQVRRIVGDRWQLPSTLVQIDMLPLGDGERVIPMSYGADEVTHLDNAVLALAPECADTPTGHQNQELLSEWLRFSSGLGRMVETSPIADVLASPIEEQDAWVQDVRRAGSCR